jgi:ribosome-binding protein aMBF1 (putative translation factor)
MITWLDGKGGCKMRHEEFVERLRRDPGYVAAEKELQPILDLADDILALRLQKGWSQEELASRVGTRQANISRVENGLANPTMAFLQKLAEALDAELVVRLRKRQDETAQEERVETSLLEENRLC